jgi:DNA repair protein RecO (recombination protein O)
MSISETEAIVLRTYNLAEADKIVVCLTRHAGLIRAVARGARRLKSRFGASLEPFTWLLINYYEKEGRELVSLRQAEIQRSFFALASDAQVLATCAAMSELILEFAPPHEPNEKLFRMLKSCLMTIANDGAPSAEVTANYFKLWLLKLSGFLPETKSCADCRRRFNEHEKVYLNAEGRFRCADCSQRVGVVLSAEAYAELRAALRLAPQEYAARPHELAAQQEIAALLEKLIERVLERALRREPDYARGKSKIEATRKRLTEGQRADANGRQID